MRKKFLSNIFVLISGFLFLMDIPTIAQKLPQRPILTKLPFAFCADGQTEMENTPVQFCPLE